jgi:hypothetical protein
VAAFSALFEHDRQLLEADASERAITARLARHLEKIFPNWDIDCEYNRHGLDPKRIGIGEDAQLVFPDVIVHHRQTDDNLLVLELKKGNSAVADERDCRKLEEMIQTFGYRHALFVRVKVTGEPTISAFEWIYANAAY